MYAALPSGVPFYVSNSVVIVGPEDTVVVDTGCGPSEARVLLAAIRSVTSRPVRFVVETHFHFDHALGAAAFPDAVVIAHQATRELLGPGSRSRTLADNLAALPSRIEAVQAQVATESDAGRRVELSAQARLLDDYRTELASIVPVLPQVTFRSELTLHAGGRELRLLHLGRGHTAGDVVVYLPKERVVCTGDLFNGYIGFMGDAYVGDWPDALERLAALEFDTVIPGHGEPFQGKDAIAPVQACLRDLWRQVLRLRATGLAADVAAARVDLRPHAARFPRLAQPGFDPVAVRRMYEVAAP